MKNMHFYFILAAATLHILSLESTAIPIKPSVPNEDKGQTLQSPPQSALDRMKQAVNGNGNGDEKGYKILSKLGSIPPNCAQKCRDCKPCVAVQVPKTKGRLGVQYANYEPEGWLCKCGTSFFSP